MRHDDVVRVATYNVHSGIGTDGVQDLERIAKVLEATGAEVIGLQEVNRHRGSEDEEPDQPGWLAERLGMEFAFAPNVDDEPAGPGLPRRQYGTALLSAHPIESSDHVLLPRYPDGEQRGLLESRVRVEGTLLRVLLTHLQHDNAAERLAQVDAIHSISHSDEPTVLLGDLNAEPDSAEYARLAERFLDVWSEVGDGPGHTFDAITPVARIDYVLLRGGVRARSAQLVRSDASDHLPLVADLDLTP